MRIGMIGCGKLGSTVALAIESKGHEVVCTDINPLAGKMFETRVLAFEEEGAQELLDKTQIKFVETTAEVVAADCDLVFVAVQTPHEPRFEGITRLPYERKDFNYDYLIAAVRGVADAAEVQGKVTVCVVISTVLPGTMAREIAPLLNPYVRFAYSPLFIAMTTTIFNYLNPEFILVGIEDVIAAETLESFYKTITQAPVCRMRVPSAELCKVAYNSFIGSKISFANTIMEICEYTSADADEVLNALHLAKDRLISPKYLKPGMADGGGCFPAGQFIMTVEGAKRIEEVQVGTMVLSEDGKLQPVLRCWEREYDGIMVTLAVEGMPPVRLTEDHRVFVCDDLRSTYTTTSRGKRIKKRRTNNGPRIGPRREVEAGEVCAGDQYMPWPVAMTYPDSFDIPSHVTDDYLELAGWYLSEGSLDLQRNKKTGNLQSGRIGFHLHQKEITDAERIAELCEIVSPHRTGGRGGAAVGPRFLMASGDLGLTVRYGNVRLAGLLEEDFGKGCVTKYIPPWILYGDPKYGALLMRGLWRGDGHTGDGGIHLSTTSPDLAYGASIILERNGIANCVRDIAPRVGHTGQKHRRAYEVQVKNAAYLGKLSELIGMPIKHKMQAKRYPNRIPMQDGYRMRKIRLVSKRKFKGKVYNLLVGETHNYVTPIGLVSNCHPRDQIAMSWLARELGLSFDFFEALMQCRENQTEWLANLAHEEALRLHMPVVVMGKAYKAGTRLTIGSPAVLLLNILREWTSDVGIFDPHIEPNITWPNRAAVYVIATPHDEFKTWIAPEGSVVLDPWGIVPKGPGVRHIGRK